MNTAIVLAEDHEIVRQGFRAILEGEPGFHVIGETGDGLEAVDLTSETQPDVLIVDLMMPSLNGLEVVRRVRGLSPETRIVVLSMHDNEAYVLEALQNGALAYVLKDSGAAELKKAVRSVLRGERYLGPPFSEGILETYLTAAQGESTPTDPFASLTNRERDVFYLTVEGLTSKEAAERLSISPRTIEKHRDNIMKKLKVSSQVELIRYAAKRGLINEAPSLPQED